MTLDCQWLGTQLEAFFAGELTADQERRARGHIDGCPRCREEIQTLHAIDPLIKNYYQRELTRVLARPSHVAARRPRIGLSVALAATTVAAILAAFLLRNPEVNTVQTAQPTPTMVAPAATVEAPPPSIKADGGIEAQRAKPVAGIEKAEATPPDSTQSAANAAPPRDANVPDFLVTDPAGYSRSLEDYRGHLLLIGVWSGDQPKAAASLERLYKAFASNPKLRLIGVSNERLAKPVNTTFPVVYNQGSRLLDAKPGEFVLLDESGAVRLRGSLTGDLGNLQALLKKN